MLENIFWLGHSSVKIKGEKIVYIDPWKLKGSEKADLILISHSHYDHLSPDDVEKIRKPGTVILTTPDSAAKLAGDIVGSSRGCRTFQDPLPRAGGDQADHLLRREPATADGCSIARPVGRISAHCSRCPGSDPLKGRRSLFEGEERYWAFMKPPNIYAVRLDRKE